VSERLARFALVVLAKRFLHCGQKERAAMGGLPIAALILFSALTLTPSSLNARLIVGA